MKYFILLIALILSFQIATFAQSSDITKINEAKIRLENLQNQLLQVDFEQRKEVARLEKEIELKGEFETTKQFEERKNKLYAQISELSLELREQTGSKRQEIHSRMNEIFKTEFDGEFDVSLGQYDADNQNFPIYLDNGISFEKLLVPLPEAKEFKENISDAKVTGKLGLILNKNNKAQPLLLSANVNFRGKNYQTVLSDLSLTKALYFFYGNYDSTSKKSTWTNYETEDFETYSLTEVSASSVLFKPFQENRIQKFLLVTQTDKENGGCHVCGATLGIVVFSKKGNYWKVDSAQKNIGEQGRWGSLDQPFLAKVGKEKYALKFSWGDMNQGYKQGGDYYFAIDNIFREILSYKTLEDSTGAFSSGENQISIKGKVSFIEGVNPDYYDAKVVISGKKAIKVRTRYVLRPYTKTEIYVYEDGKYKLKEK